MVVRVSTLGRLVYIKLFLISFVPIFNWEVTLLFLIKMSGQQFLFQAVLHLLEILSFYHLSLRAVDYVVE